MNPDWTLKGVEIPLADVASLAGVPQNQIGKMMLDGVLGPPQASTGPAKAPLLHIGALLASLDAGKCGITQHRIREALPAMSGGVFVQLVFGELKLGHLQVGRGMPHLLNRLRSDAGRALIEETLPFPVQTKRFVCFSERRVILCDTLAELDGVAFEAPYVIVDTMDIAARMKRFLRGPFFFAQAASTAAAA